MDYDLIIPFVILIVLVIYFIYTRNKFEKNIVKLYENKFENWKENSLITTSQKSCKILVGLVFKKDDKISVELFDKSVEKLVEKKEFKIDSINIMKDKK